MITIQSAIIAILIVSFILISLGIMAHIAYRILSDDKETCDRDL